MVHSAGCALRALLAVIYLSSTLANSYVCQPDTCRNSGTCSPRFYWPYYHCDCIHGYYGHHCEHLLASPTTQPIVTTSTPAPTQPTTRSPKTTPLTRRLTSTPGTTIKPLARFHCSKYLVVYNLAESIVSTHENATTCSSAFVLDTCPVKHPAEWRVGRKIMTNCDTIPAYTAIVSSTGNQHVSKNSISGIFIECLNNPDGFKMAVQNCDSAPYIEHVVSRGNNDRTDPDIYFTIS
ncbi:uncharacterized protein LOC128241858 isoform X2 [Mya arenaria]|uniref:uncharacterized protein LOC128241858 isoform X2 n=1 Tax=Mya arenaria TaxID=6604 RepID=UPI0022E8ACEF|nr:uncharacterized protein LOC128241858 isoform X2 [Mya arenaria]